MSSVPVVFASIAGSIVVSITLTVLVAVGARAVLRRLKRPSAAMPPAGRAQLARIEQALDAIELEVERLGEAQRFLVRLHAERVHRVDELHVTR